MADAPTPARDAKKRPSWRQRLLLVALGIALPVLLLALVELALTLFGVGEDHLYDDPFVGFSPGSDLFALRRPAEGPAVYATNPEKLTFFNEQRFAAEKPRDGYRIFSLGGSTTAGRPYDDRVAFARWLGLYLDAADPSREWESVNAGAISYASYRVVVLMRELVRYEPDLFVVYTGHNEFLEERSYEDILDQPPAVRRVRAWLSGFRFASLVRSWTAPAPEEEAEEGEAPKTLAPEVVAKLDGWTGLDRYERDDELARSVLEHFEFNLRQMVRIARDHGAGIVFVEPVSNVADFSPFKSEHTAGLTAADRARAEALLAAGRERLDAGDAAAAAGLFAEALAFDPRHAELHYRHGQALLAAGDGEAAYQAFVRAKDEDVAPLRALEPVVAAVRRVAAEEGVPLVPLRQELEAENRRRFGHPALGDDFLLDHVHPDVPVHSLVAERLLDLMVEEGTVEPATDWDEQRRAAIYQAELAGFDREYYARRDLNLSKVLGWAGKLEEAEKPLRRAAEVLPEEPEVWLNLGIVEQRTGRYEAALASFDRAAALAPEWELVHFNRGVVYGHLGRLDDGVAALRRALALRADYPEARYNLGLLLRRRGDLEGSLAALAEAERLGAASGEVAFNRALVYRRQGRLEEAEAIFRRLVEADGSDAAARTELAVTLARRGELGAAAGELDRALESDPGYAEAHYNRGVLEAQRGDAAAAEAAYRRALELAPNHPQANVNLGIAYAGRGDLATARGHFETAVAADPGYAEARFNLGVALDGLGRPAEALAAIERAVELEPGNGRFQLALGTLYAARGDARRALDHLERARAGGQSVPAELLADLRRRAG